MNKKIDIEDEMVTPEFVSSIKERLKQGSTDFDEYETQFILKHFNDLQESPKKKSSKKSKGVEKKIEATQEKQKSPGKLALTLATFSTGMFGTATPALMASGMSAGEASVIAVTTSLGVALVGLFSQAIANKLEINKLKKQLKAENNITLTNQHTCGSLNLKTQLKECEIFRSYGAGI